MKNLKSLFILFFITITTVSCFEDLDDNPVSNKDLNDFVWKGLNSYYLYKDNVPNLADDRFTESEYDNFLNSFAAQIGRASCRERGVGLGGRRTSREKRGKIDLQASERAKTSSSSQTC